MLLNFSCLNHHASASKALIAGFGHRNLLPLWRGAGTAYVQLDLVPYGDVDHVVHDATVRKDQPGREDVDIYRHVTVETCRDC